MTNEDKIFWLRECSGLPQEKIEEYIAILDELEQQKRAMSQEQIMAYAAKIRPVLFGSNGEARICPQKNDEELYWLKSTPIATTSCTFMPEAIAKAGGLKEIGRIESYHPFSGYYGFLRPSAAEAIYQCPTEILNKACAFAFVAEDLDVRSVCDFNIDMHKLTTVYFEGTVPPEIVNDPIKW
ncbi:MAG: hypothetical protein SO314_07495 [Alphaproteobacteria bacterium]|nr:hypothetical protein [Alphaproteobacteria bacterium]